MKMRALLEVRGKDPYRKRKGRVLAIMLLGMMAGMLIVAVFNAAKGQAQYNLVNGAFSLLLVGLFALNRLGFVYLAGLSAVLLTGVGSFFLIDENLERAYRESRYQALHDPLTDLPNRALFLDRLEQELADAERAGRVVAVLFIDLDNFKVINDSLGHHLGDRLLVEVSLRIRNCLRSRDSAARFGGDEFTILLANLWDAGAAIRVTERLLEALSEPFVIAKHDVTVSASVGIALGQGDRAQPADLLRNADTAP